MDLAAAPTRFMGWSSGVVTSQAVVKRETDYEEKMAATPNATDDDELLKRIVEHDHSAFSTLVTRHTDRYYRIAFRVVNDKNEAEGVVQEAFLKLWKNPGRWDATKKTKFTTWFYKVVTNLCIDRNRKKRPMQMIEGFDLADKGPSLDARLVKKEERQLVDRLLAALPERQQMALNLCFYEGVSNKEAAEIMGLSLKALQSLIIRGKTTLKEKAGRRG